MDPEAGDVSNNCMNMKYDNPGGGMSTSMDEHDESRQKARADRKRHREKQRRVDVNIQFQDLTSLLERIDKDGCLSSEKISHASTSNRVNIIARTIAVLERLHEENVQRDMEIEVIKQRLAQVKGGTTTTSTSRSSMNGSVIQQQQQQQKTTFTSSSTSRRMSNNPSDPNNMCMMMVPMLVSAESNTAIPHPSAANVLDMFNMQQLPASQTQQSNSIVSNNPNTVSGSSSSQQQPQVFPIMQMQNPMATTTALASAAGSTASATSSFPPMQTMMMPANPIMTAGFTSSHLETINNDARPLNQIGNSPRQTHGMSIPDMMESQSSGVTNHSTVGGISAASREHNNPISSDVASLDCQPFTLYSSTTTASCLEGSSSTPTNTTKAVLAEQKSSEENGENGKVSHQNTNDSKPHSMKSTSV